MGEEYKILGTSGSRQRAPVSHLGKQKHFRSERGQRHEMVKSDLMDRVEHGHCPLQAATAHPSRAHASSLTYKLEVSSSDLQAQLHPHRQFA